MKQDGKKTTDHASASGKPSTDRVMRFGWGEGVVDIGENYIELRHGSGRASDWITVARVGPPSEGAFCVEFIVDRGDPSNEGMIEAVLRELEFYLEHGGPHAWEYAKYHCSTASNWYSSVHWLFFDGKGETGDDD